MSHSFNPFYTDRISIDLYTIDTSSDVLVNDL